MFPRKSGCCSFCHKKTAWQNCNNPLSPGPTSAIPRPAERPGFPPCLPRRGGGAKSQRPGGRRRGAKRPERAHPGPRAPGALFCLAGRGQPCGPPPAAKRRRPGAYPTAPASPIPSLHPSAIWELPGGAGRPAATPGRRRFAGPRPAKPPQGRGPKAPALAVWALRAPAAPAGPPSLPPTPKRRRKARPHDGAWPIKRRQEGTRQRLYPLDKAAAHALRAAAAYTALPRATAASRQQPLLRGSRRPRRAAVRVAPWQRGGRCGKIGMRHIPRQGGAVWGY